MSGTVGFLGMLDAEEIEKAGDKLTIDTEVKKGVPNFLRNVEGSVLSLEDLMSTGTRTPPTQKEWEKYSGWLREQVRLPQQLVDEEVRKQEVNARMAIFLHFYRLDIPVTQITDKLILTKPQWEKTAKRFVWQAAKGCSVPMVNSGNGMQTQFTHTWWFKPKPAPAIKGNRSPKVIVYHKLQTSDIPPKPKIKKKLMKEAIAASKLKREQEDRAALWSNYAGEGQVGQANAARDLTANTSEWEAKALESWMTNMSVSGNDEVKKDHGMALMEGKLKRKGSVSGRWKTGWYVLTGGSGVAGMLSEYKSQEFCFKPKHAMMLDQVTVQEVTSIQGKPTRSCTFALLRRNKSPIYLRAQNKIELIKWMGALVTYSEIPDLDLNIGILTNPAVTCNEKGSVLDFNAPAEQLFGYSRTEAIGKNVKFLIHSKKEKKHHDGYLQAYVQGGNRNIIGKARQVTAVHKNGKPITLTLSVGEYLNKGRRCFFGNFCIETASTVVNATDFDSTDSTIPNAKANTTTEDWDDTSTGSEDYTSDDEDKRAKSKSSLGRWTRIDRPT